MFSNSKYHIYSLEQFKVTISKSRTFQNVIKTFQNVPKIKVTKCGEKCSKCGKNELEPFSMGKRTWDISHRNKMLSVEINL